MFGLTEEQKQLQRAVRAFAEGEIAPHVSEWDEKSEFPHEVVKKLGEMGLLGVIFPESLGGVETLICHPATMTHAAGGAEGRARLGITDGLMRVSVGIEDVEDIMADLGQALEKI